MRRTATPDIDLITSEIEAKAGDTITIQITPSGLGGFYAIQEEWDGLIFAGSHTADNYVAPNTFVMITESPFTYELQVPPSANTGDEFTIQGLFWTDPNVKMQSDILTVLVTSSVLHKGDFDGNGCIELYDFVEFAGAFGSQIGDPNYNPVADFDDNGEIGLYDFVEFAGVFGTCY